ncbi:Ger(x)C family spore germination protein [Bacillus luteolus]|uniref:Ger(X)C family spore germination protein n=1 Tax=Litchfieldia luteola TaxID=682179 RepID=A0ABR9QN69_9BACI|nr:Ger(x)C family spore germination protein [Cytobacillus luteolus]MBE4909894.1 Ger(x)C family spore germination protein [Cytobacillus luteolus]MBP1942552.1 spore germination protein [Cytobacillus luteolus]
MKQFRQFFLLLLVFLTGCEALIPSKVINEIDIIQGAGYDLTEEQEIKSHFMFPIYKGRNEPPSTKTITATGDSSKDTRDKANRKTRYQIMSGQIRVMLFSKTFSEKGIFTVLDTYNRDPSVGRIAQLAIVDGDTSEVLDRKFKEVDNIALHLQEMIEQNIKNGTLPRTDINTFMYQYHQEGIDPYLPIIEVNGDEVVIIPSVGIMKNDKLVFQVSKHSTFIFCSMVEKRQKGIHQTTLENNDNLAIEVIRSRPIYDVEMKNGEPTITIQLNIKARVIEYSSSNGETLSNDKKEIEKNLEKHLKDEGTDLIKQFRELNVDPLGLGAKYEAQVRSFDSEKWNEQYPNTQINLKVDVKIIETGITE